MTRSARMIDVAKLAGVSTMTVSRVLNDSPNVTGGLRARVLAAVDQLHYQPNELARSLREQRSRQIGIVVPYLFDPFFAICAHSISTVAKQHSYSVVLSTSNEDARAEFDEASHMLRRNVEGLIVIPAHPRKGPSLLLAEEFQRLPIVALDRPVEGAPFHSVLVDNEQGAAVGTEHLLSLGHKRIAYIGLPNELYTMRMRHLGYSNAMRAAGLRTKAAFLPGALADSMLTVRELLQGKHPPTAIFCANNLTTRHVLHSLQAMGIFPPHQIALVGFDDFETADLVCPGVTVVRQPNELLGQTAANALFEQLSGTRRLPRSSPTVLPTELVVRRSCGAHGVGNTAALRAM